MKGLGASHPPPGCLDTLVGVSRQAPGAESPDDRMASAFSLTETERP